MKRVSYGVDSPAIVAGYFVAAALAFAAAVFFRSRVAAAIGTYCAMCGFGMLRYSLSEKLMLRDRLLDGMAWRGNETVLDAGCGRGLLLIGAAKRLSDGRAIGLDLWLAKAITGNNAEAVIRNAEAEGVADRVELRTGDIRELPFESAKFDVVISNFVLHELDTRADRGKMLREILRVLKPGGRLALIDFIFTRESVVVLRAAGASAVKRERIDSLRSRISSLLFLGAFRPCLVSALKAIE